jgi:hypothetical protein
MLALLILNATLAMQPSPQSHVQGFINVTDLHVICENKTDQLDATALCMGYIIGAIDQLLAQQARRPRMRQALCLPEGISTDTIRTQVLRSVKEGVDQPSVGAAASIQRAVEAAYPCKSRTIPGFSAR